MPDTLATGPAAPPKEIRLEDYKVPPFLVDTVDLVFDLKETGTRVTSRMTVRRNPDSQEKAAPLFLDGEDVRLVSVALNGEILGENRYALSEGGLTIPDMPDAFTLDVEAEIDPAENTELSGLYTSGGTFCTQCEAEGFRRITFFPDRPDVMSRYTVTMLADKAAYPILLSNGNRIDGGDATGGRHWAKWEDPHPKPSYLFALVAGDLVALSDSFTTRSRRKVALNIHVRRGDEDKCDHAMRSLKTSMAWDEEVYGLEYDLDLFNIVAVSDFNMGAMENKGLNIFNTKYILAKPDTATDFDYHSIERVVAHEYFHNWTGDRVTCRDWFQLSLKEGLTVFRDQQFSADQGSAAVRRIGDVARLRATQFPEDSGPMAHPVRPERYIAIDNFYTATVYQKGAEVVRMIHTLIGAEAFRKGMDLYIERHDNQAVTIEDLVAAMRDASGVDFTQFRRWYSTAGTPELTVKEEHDPATGRYALTVGQHIPPTPGQEKKDPLLIPLAVGLLSPDGNEVLETNVLKLTEREQRFVFEGHKQKPVPSLLRGFSAPVKLAKQPRERLKFLFAHDTDPFARWEAGQQFAAQLLLDMVKDCQSGAPVALDPDFIDIFARTLADGSLNPAFRAEALTLPGDGFLADQMTMVDVEAIDAALTAARRTIAEALHGELVSAYKANEDNGPYKIDPDSVGRRALKNLCLATLGVLDEDAEAAALVDGQFRQAGNMTDRLAALSVLNDSARPARAAALEAFRDRWKDDPLVMDKWFTLQATSRLPGTVEAVERLTRHEDYDPRNPNRVRAVLAAFGSANPLHFHRADGAGYAFLADRIIALDRHNAQLSARLISPLGRWRRQDPGRQALMKQALERILATEGLSKDSFEIASKSLA